MSESEPLRSPAATPMQTPGRYHVDVLPWAEVGEHGVSYLAGGCRETLQWASVLRAFAAEVGEPEGVRAVVFDLVVERKDDECWACRFDADPGPEARGIALRVTAGVGHERCSRSLLALAADGSPTRSFADLDALADDALEELGL
jgi:hypothetical protein